MSLHQVLTILWARKWITLLALLSAIAAAVAAVFILPPQYTATTSVMMDTTEPDPITGQTLPSPMLLNHQRTQLALLKSDRVAREVVGRLRLAEDPQYRAAYMEATEGRGEITRWIADRLKENLNAGFVDGSNVMSIAYTAQSPQIAAVMANTFKSTYLAANLDLKVEPARRNAQWYTAQIDGLRRETEEARQRLLDFQQKNKLLVQESEGGGIESAKLLALTERLLDARAQLAAAQGGPAVPAETAEDGGSAVTGEMPAEVGPVNRGAAPSPTMIALQSSLASVEAELGQLSSQLGPNNPKLAALRASRASILSRIEEEEARSRDDQAGFVEALRRHVSELEKAVEEQQAKMLDMQDGREQLAALTRELEVRRQRLDEAEARAASLRMQGQQSFVNVVSLDEAAPPSKPAFPNTLLILVMATGFGLALGVILSLFIEMLDRRVRTFSDLQDAVGVKPLGALASAKVSRRQMRRSGEKFIGRGGTRMLPAAEPGS